MQRKLSDSRNKVGDIFYTPRPPFTIFQILKIEEGYKDKYGYSDENANTLTCWDFVDQQIIKMDSRSQMSELFIHDMGGSSTADVGFSDRHAHIIGKLFEEYG